MIAMWSIKYPQIRNPTRFHKNCMRMENGHLDIDEYTLLGGGNNTTKIPLPLQ